MRNLKYGFVGFLMVWCTTLLPAHVGTPSPKRPSKSTDRKKAEYRMNCAQSTAQIDQSINNVRARLLAGGDVWWDGNSNGRYIVPKVPEGEQEVAAIFAGAVWLGGFDEGGNLKVACQTYGTSSGQTDFWPGPLTDEQQVGPDTCANWDRFFKVLGANVAEHRRNWRLAVEANGGDPDGVELDRSQIPEDVLGWPGLGNPFFEEIHGFSLPLPAKGFRGLAGFEDVDDDAVYDPTRGDFPRIEIRRCRDRLPPSLPDEMIFWIYNDAGGIHTETNGEVIGMEVQVQAFSFQTSDQINNMTFQRYRLVNRATEPIDSTFFAMWVDPDLGCFRDDYVGCDVDRSLAYVYNSDNRDGMETCNDCEGVNTYCTDIPVLGVDYFQGPLDEFGEELGMSSFTYYDNARFNPNQGMTDPEEAPEYYNYLSGSWRNGVPFTQGGTGYDPSSTDFTKYVFPGEPNDPARWSMCSEALTEGDRRTIQASGPFRLDPGTINELIIGVVWVPSFEYPCPDVTRLLQADDIAQSLFDNCFELTRGPYAPDVNWVELDEEVIAVLSNPDVASTANNFELSYAAKDIKAPGSCDSGCDYRFEGYQIYQLLRPVAPDDLNDPDQARLVAQVDIKNGIDVIYNWGQVPNPNADLSGEPEFIYLPEERAVGADAGIQHTFRFTEDAFGGGKLINHRTYYYTAIAYGYNNWEDFTQRNGIPEGQQNPYIPSDLNIQQYSVIPRPTVDSRLRSQYGDGPLITRLAGLGIGGKSVEITEATRTAILDGSARGRIEYQEGKGPLDIKIYDPLLVQDGDFRLELKDATPQDSILDDDAFWELTDLSTSTVIAASGSIASLNEEIIPEYGFSISVTQTSDVGDLQAGNGVLGFAIEYADQTGPEWFSAVEDSDEVEVFNFMQTSPGESDFARDPEQAFNKAISPTFWSPYTLAEIPTFFNTLVSPAWSSGTRGDQLQAFVRLHQLNNVDIVLTSDKSKWSRCVVIESASQAYTHSSRLNLPSEGERTSFQLRAAPSVTRYAGPDGLPAVDPEESREGFGWFPGYAIDVETGRRLNIFFGENSTYSCESLTAIDRADLCDLLPNGGRGNGRDMLWNPTAERVINILPRDNTPEQIYPFYAGGQHYIYVTNQSYDGCEALHEVWSLNSPSRLVDSLSPILTWTCIPLASELLPLGTGESGLIPNEVTFRLRVDNPYQVSADGSENGGYPTYEFSFRGVEREALQTEEEFAEELAQIRVVPNPYYGYSIYESTQFTNIVKITNLPADCEVNIYGLDGRFIRHYGRNEGPRQGAATNQINPDLEWDLRNSKGLSVASGTYLIHVAAEGKGERVLKFFAVQRQFDPSGL